CGLAIGSSNPFTPVGLALIARPQNSPNAPHPNHAMAGLIARQFIPDFRVDIFRIPVVLSDPWQHL
ncbi:MAG: hypothetical protein K6E83_03885, partial [Clostridium sp.]|nr:hypothetical protein [Clostridium sp.]